MLVNSMRKCSIINNNNKNIKKETEKTFKQTTKIIKYKTSKERNE